MKVTRVVSDPRALGSAGNDEREVFVADPDTANWYTALEGRTYDVVMVADLLEHQRDPSRVLRDLRDHRLLASAGWLLVSFANVAHAAVMDELLSGDSTRIRWYTVHSMSRALSASGYLLVETHHTQRRPDGQTTTSAGADAQTCEYVLLVQPSDAGPQLAQLQRELDDAAQRLTEAEAARDQISSLLKEERTAFQNEIGRGADELEQLQRKVIKRSDECSALRSENAQLRRELARLQDELAVTTPAKRTAERRLAAVQRSRSYRVSRGLTRAAHVVFAPLRSHRRPLRRGD